MEIILKENERIDDLEYKGLQLIQNKNWFCFGIDSVLLSDFAKNIKNNSRVLDLGTGTGIIGMLLCKKTNLKQIKGIEIQPDVAEMAARSVKLNDLDDKFEIINDNIKNIENYFSKGTFDVVVTNPPYKKENSGIINDCDNKVISRHEITANLEDFIYQASIMLKDNGSMYMVHKPERLCDIVYLMRKHNLEPKELKFVYSNIKSEPSLILIKGCKNGHAFLKINKPLFIYQDDGSYTKDILEIYGK